MTKSPASLYERERVFNKVDPNDVPRFGVCFSGGGNRSAAFAIGVLRALHKSGLLSKVDVMSAVSGGSYALSWFLLQPFYHEASLDDPRSELGGMFEEMFDLNGPFQRYLTENAKPIEATGWADIILMAVLTLPFDLVFFNALRILSAPLSIGSGATKVANVLNAQSMARKSYRNGIQRSYHVSPVPEKKAPAEKLTLWETSFVYSQHLNLTRQDITPVSFPTLSEFAQRSGLPSFVFNTTVRPPRPGDDVPLGDRIFELGPMGFGSNSCGYLRWDETEGFGWEPGKPVEKNWLQSGLRRDSSQDGELVSPYATLRTFNVAPAISGAALSGTNIEHAKMRLPLRLLNMGLEYVVPSPADRRRAVRLSDGGHSENLGAYALLRRRCRSILIVDAEHDPSYSFGAYRKLKQAACDELNLEIEIPGLEEILNDCGVFSAEKPILNGTIAGDYEGTIHYLKLSMHADGLGDQAEFITPYAERYRAFPQESTRDQYFQDAQFRAYRALGYAIARGLSPDIAG